MARYIIKELKVYYKSEQNIVERNSILDVDNKLIIPKTLRPYMIKQLHKSHFGMEKTKRRSS